MILAALLASATPEPASNVDRLAVPCRVERVSDGDTIRCAGLGRVRIAGIDAPELHSRCRAERALAIRSRDRLTWWLASGRVTVHRLGPDRDVYGRLLRDVRVNGVSVGRRMIEEGFARVWRGRRMPWC
jgi:micrococcal nuclease